MENRDQVKGRFNFIDVLIILMVLALIAVVVYMTVSDKDSAEKSERAITYTVKLSGINEDYLPLITAGSKVTDSSTGKLIGTISDVRSEKTKYIGSKAVADSQGKYSVAYSEYDNLYDVYVTLYVNGSVDSRGIAYAGGNKILVGSKLYFRCGTFAGTSFCTAFGIE